MDNFVFYFYEVTDLLDVSYKSEYIRNIDIITYTNYEDLTTIFLLGLFTSLCTLTFCYTSKKSTKKYYVVQQESENDKIITDKIITV